MQTWKHSWISREIILKGKATRDSVALLRVGCNVFQSFNKMDWHILTTTLWSVNCFSSRKSCDWTQHLMLHEIWAAVQNSWSRPLVQTSPIGGLFGWDLACISTSVQILKPTFLVNCVRLASKIFLKLEEHFEGRSHINLIGLKLMFLQRRLAAKLLTQRSISKRRTDSMLLQRNLRLKEIQPVEGLWIRMCKERLLWGKMKRTFQSWHWWTQSVQLLTCFARQSILNKTTVQLMSQIYFSLSHVY